jgi:uncharacterized repeat protein (TIGR03803 family)
MLIAKFVSISVVTLFATLTAADAAKEKVLHEFTGQSDDGGSPAGDLIGDAQGNVYGTTVFGGAFGEGTIFKVSPRGRETILHSFNGIPDGSVPEAGLVMDGAGNLYGTASGGTGGSGVVFELTRKNQFTVLYAFRTNPDGQFPHGSLVLDASGNLYGTTEEGGTKCPCGTVFKVTPTGEETILYSFGGGTDGRIPKAGLILSPDGQLYGTTAAGGGNCDCGTVFKISMDGTETLLHSFSGGRDGSEPSGQLIADSTGKLYGVTAAGGHCGCGPVFSISPEGKEEIVYAFGKGAGYDGAQPVGRLVLDADGNLYGATHAGGPMDYGTVFKVRAAPGKERVLHLFAGGDDGANPYAGMVDIGGALIGTTGNGGSYGEGVVFKIKK